MERRELLRHLAANPHTVRFREFVELIEQFGFQLVRVRGSHHMFRRPGFTRLVNIQEQNGRVKAYQVRQFLKLVEMYNLDLEERN